MQEQSCSHSIKQWPELDRPREKFSRFGPEALTDSELLSILIRNGHSRNGTAVDQARRLLETFGSLARIADAGLGELCKVDGIGPVKAVTIHTAFEIARRGRIEAPLKEGGALKTSRDAYRSFGVKLAAEKTERFVTILLDTKNRPIREVSVAQGALDSCAFHPREAYYHAVREGAAAVLFLHNHPSGDPDPSHDDKVTTTRLVEAGRLMGVRVLDHLVVGREGYVSFRDEGLI